MRKRRPAPVAAATPESASLPAAPSAQRQAQLPASTPASYRNPARLIVVGVLFGLGSPSASATQMRALVRSDPVTIRNAASLPQSRRNSAGPFGPASLLSTPEVAKATAGPEKWSLLLAAPASVQALMPKVWIVAAFGVAWACASCPKRSTPSSGVQPSVPGLPAFCQSVWPAIPVVL